MGSKPTRNNFLRFLKEKTVKKSEKSDKRNFCAFFFSRLTEKRYFGEKSTEKSEIFVLGLIYLPTFRDDKLTGKFGYPSRPVPFGTGMEILYSGMRRVWVPSQKPDSGLGRV